MEISRKVETSGEIVELMKQLENELCRAITKECNGLDVKELSQLSASKQATWSGGHTVTNLYEQHLRQTASRMVSNYIENNKRT